MSSAPTDTLREVRLLEVVLTHRLVSGIPAQTLEAGICKVLTGIEIFGVALSEVSSKSVILELRKVGTAHTR